MAFIVLSGCSVNRIRPGDSIDANIDEFNGRYERLGKLTKMYRFSKVTELDGINGKDEDISFVLNSKNESKDGQWCEIQVEGGQISVYDENRNELFSSTYRYDKGIECDSESIARIFILINFWGCRAISMYLDKEKNLLIDDYEQGSGAIIFFSASNQMNRHYLFKRLE